jgi:hypothetical protein
MEKFLKGIIFVVLLITLITIAGVLYDLVVVWIGKRITDVEKSLGGWVFFFIIGVFIMFNFAIKIYTLLVVFLLLMVLKISPFWKNRIYIIFGVCLAATIEILKNIWLAPLSYNLWSILWCLIATYFTIRWMYKNVDACT